MRDTLRQTVLDMLIAHDIGAANISYSATGNDAIIYFSDRSWANCTYLDGQWVDLVTLAQPIVICRQIEIWRD